MGPDGQSHMSLRNTEVAWLFFLKKLAFDYSKMKAVMGKVFRNRPTIKPTERT